VLSVCGGVWWMWVEMCGGDVWERGVGDAWCGDLWCGDVVYEDVTFA
jgi:hypothetical protein